MADEDGGRENDPDVIDPLQGLIDPFFGHGTFIAGLIHQTCPDADVLSIKMMSNDGIVDEAALLNGLGFLHQRQVDALGAGEPGIGDLVDIVCLSLGYYHESDLAGVTYDSRLKKALDALAEVGIMVVAAAGNNATSRPLLPAAFTLVQRRHLHRERHPGATGQRRRPQPGRQRRPVQQRWRLDLLPRPRRRPGQHHAEGRRRAATLGRPGRRAARPAAGGQLSGQSRSRTGSPGSAPGAAPPSPRR